MERNSRIGQWLAVASSAAVLGVAACAPLGNVLNGDLGGLTGTTVYGEVRGVDRSRLQLRNEYDGRTETMRMDGRTRVVYQSREYPVTALERGDRVAVRVTRDRNNVLWAEHIDVRESVNNGDDGGYYGGEYARVQRLDGTVTAVDVRRGVFALQQSRTSAYTVYVPERANITDERRFARLRRGDRARVDVRVIGRNRAQLVRFR